MQGLQKLLHAGGSGSSGWPTRPGSATVRLSAAGRRLQRTVQLPVRQSRA